ncbi:MAG: ribosome biogenesis GTPase Der [bacterium]
MEKPVVTIVGRPNVGKSTLFNRIIQRREAIVDDRPGVTRDRKGIETEWEGYAFVLFDTGGFIPKTRNIMEAGVTNQVKAAIAESDLIVFMVDCQTGITDFDDEVVKILRKTNKDSLLVVNKVDSVEKEAYASEFYNLGCGEPILISAAAGRNIGDLLSEIVAGLKNKFHQDIHSGEGSENIQTEDEVIKLAIVGRPNTGKSTYINKILNQERLLVTEIPGTTRDSIDIGIQFQGINFLVIDTAGLRKKPKINDTIEYYSSLRTDRVINKCDVAAVFMDGSQGLTSQDLHVMRKVVDAEKGTILVVNKWDLIKNDDQILQNLEIDLSYKLKGFNYLPVITVSSLQGIRVYKLLIKIKEIFNQRKKRISSPELNKFLKQLNRNYQPPAVKNKLVRIKYGCQTKAGPPEFVFFSNHPQLVKESYKRFLENKIRKQFGFEGVPFSLIFKKSGE